MNEKLLSPDPLSGILDRLRTVPWSAGVASFPQRWTVETPPGLTSFYVAAQGSFFLVLDDGTGTLETVPQGTYVLLTHGTPHRLFDEVGSPVVSWSAAGRPTLNQQWERTNGTRSTVVYGHFPSALLGNHCFDVVFPRLACLDGPSTPLLSRCAPMLDLLVEERRDARAGWQTVVSEVVRTLFTQAVRCLTLELQADGQFRATSNWLHAALDTSIGPILALLHDSPEKPWTVGLLARQARMAKSAFSERFREAVGQPPLKYLTEYRINLACQLLRDTDFGVREVAGLVGYESASSFSNAFKRWVGLSPAVYRRNGVTGNLDVPEAEVV